MLNIFRYSLTHNLSTFNPSTIYPPPSNFNPHLDPAPGMNSQGQRLIDCRNERDGTTALHVACKYNDGGAGIQVLMQAAPLVNSKDHRGQTPLHYATSRGNDTSIKVTEASLL